MTRLSRIDKPGYYYHVISRGQRKETLFFSPVDYSAFVKFLKEVLADTDIELSAYCLMKNHFHLLLKRNEDPLYDFMHRLNLKYALYLNHKYKFSGYVFQGRFKSFIVLNNDYLVNLVLYIHNNPVKDSITAEEEEFNYSSARFYHGKTDLFELPLIKIPIFAGSAGVEKYKLFLKEGKINFPKYKDGIGNKDEYLLLEKRRGKNVTSFYIEKRKEKSTKDSIGSDFINILKSLNLNTGEILTPAFRFEMISKEKRDEIILSLIKSGYSVKIIADFLKINIQTIYRCKNKMRSGEK